MKIDNPIITSSTGWSPSPLTLDQVAVGKTVSASISEYLDGAIEHVAVWETVLSSSEVSDLYDQTINPADVQPDYLVSYTPLVDSIDDVTDTWSWTTVNITTPSYESSGVDYPAPFSESFTPIIIVI